MADETDGKQVNTETLLKNEPGEEQKAEEAKIEAAKTEEAKIEAAKTEEAKIEAAKTEEQKAEEAKIEAAKTEEQKAEEAKIEAAKKEGAPEKYEAYKLPEGAVVNDELTGEFNAIAKEANLSQEQAQKLIDLLPKQFEAFAAKQAEGWKETRDAWVKDIKEDKELGGEKLNETLERANRTLRKFGSEGLKTFLTDSGFGDSSDLVRMLAKLDVALGEDYVVDGGPSGETGEKGAAETMYPDQGK